MEKSSKINIHHLFWYFLIFSILGLVIETIYCYCVTGVIESRKGLIWGPFCPVYGVCGSILILVLDKLQVKGYLKLFVSGFIFGSIAEYILSYCLEAIYGMKFWNYEYLSWNLNGRISLLFSLYWGILSVVLIKFVKSAIDKLIAKIKPHTRNIIELGIFIFLCIDCIFTVWGIQTYKVRVIYGTEYKSNSNNIMIKLKENIENNYFNNERMSTNFPNLRFKDENGKEIWVKSLLNK